MEGDPIDFRRRRATWIGIRKGPTDATIGAACRGRAMPEFLSVERDRLAGADATGAGGAGGAGGAETG